MPPSESLKRQAEDYDAEQVHKLQRLDTTGEEVVAAPELPQPGGRKKKSAAGASSGGAASRTGQACDRCKSRKIRCDDTQGGCMPCRQNNTECKTTDRVTQRATTRGYTEAIERDNSTLRQQLLELEQQLRELGAEPKTVGRYAAVRDQPYTPGWPSQAGANGHIWDNGDRNGLPYEDARAGQETNLFAIPPEPKVTPADGWCGISTSSSLMSPNKGTSLSLFGARIDISDFVADALEESQSPSSYNNLLRLVAVGSGGRTSDLVSKAKLPDTYVEAASYTKWYLSSLNPWCPVLHKPQMMDLVLRWYQEPNFEPTPAEQVMMHMVHGSMKYQLSIRNRENTSQQAELLEEALAHYHYALSFYNELVVSRTLADMQAISIITVQARSFAKPSTAWMLCVWSMTLALDLGLHRTSKVWAEDSSKKDPLEIEMGKRVFYTLLQMHITLSGRLGHPMPLREEDFDVEIPEPMDDSLPSETGDPSPPSCSWEATIHFFKISVLFLETYNNIYAVRPSGDYEKNIQTLQVKLERWRQELPPTLSEASLADERSEKRVFGLWVHSWEAEFRMLLHHPSLNRTSSQEFANQTLNNCMHAASKYLELQFQVRNIRCLDATWTNTVVYIAAVSTLLFAYWERRDQISSSDLAKLRVEMEQALDVIGDVGVLLGSGQRLRETIRPIIEASLGQVDRFMAEKTASAAVARAGLQASIPIPQTRKDAATTNTEAQDLSAALQSTSTPPDIKPTVYPVPQDHPLLRPHPAYQPALYPDAAGVDATTHFYAPFDPAAATSVYETRMPPQQTPPQTAQDAYMFPHQSSGYAAPPPSHISSGVMAWRQWTETLKDQMEPTDFIDHPANALMALTGREGGAGAGASTAGHQGAGLQDMASAANMHHAALLGAGVVTAQQWPMSAFDKDDDK